VFFCEEKMEYLGYVVFLERVGTNPKKIEVMKNLSISYFVKELRGFLGLTGYHKKFIRGFGFINKPLIKLLKNTLVGMRRLNQLLIRLKRLCARLQS